jgi:hypothetical protein
MFEVYIYNGTEYEVSPDQKERFLKDFPKAELKQNNSNNSNNNIDNKNLKVHDFVDGSESFSVSEDQLDRFMKDHPNAKQGNFVRSGRLRTGFEEEDFLSAQDQAMREYNEQVRAPQKERDKQQEEINTVTGMLGTGYDEEIEKKIKKDEELVRDIGQMEPMVWKTSLYGQKEDLMNQMKNLPDGPEKEALDRQLFGVNFKIADKFRKKDVVEEQKTSEVLKQKTNDGPRQYVVRNGVPVPREFVVQAKGLEGFDEQSIFSEASKHRDGVYYVVTNPNSFQNELWSPDYIQKEAKKQGVAPEKFIAIKKQGGYKFNTDGEASYDTRRNSTIMNIPDELFSYVQAKSDEKAIADYKERIPKEIDPSAAKNLNDDQLKNLGFNLDNPFHLQYLGRETEVPNISIAEDTGTPYIIPKPNDASNGKKIINIIDNLRGQLRDITNSNIPEEEKQAQRQRLIEVNMRAFGADDDPNNEKIKYFLQSITNDTKFDTEEEAVEALVPDFYAVEPLRKALEESYNAKQEEMMDTLYKMTSIKNKALVEEDPDKIETLQNAYSVLQEKYSSQYDSLSEIHESTRVLSDNALRISDEVSMAVENNAIKNAAGLSYSKAAKARNSILELGKTIRESFLKFSDNLYAAEVNQSINNSSTLKYIDKDLYEESRISAANDIKEVHDKTQQKILESATERNQALEKFSKDLTIQEARDFAKKNEVSLMSDYVMESMSSQSASHAVSSLMWLGSMANPGTLTAKAAIYATPTVFGVSSFGRTYGDLLYQNNQIEAQRKTISEMIDSEKASDNPNEEKLSYLQKEYETLAGARIYSEGEMVGAAILDGAIEYGFTYGSGALFRSNALRRIASRDAVRLFGRDMKLGLPTKIRTFANANRTTLQKTAIKGAEIFGLETAEETAIAAAQGYGTRGLFLGQDVGDEDVFGPGGFGDFYTKTAINSFIMGGGLSGLSTGLGITNAHVLRKRFDNKVKGFSKEMNDLQNQLNESVENLKNIDPTTKEFSEASDESLLLALKMKALRAKIGKEFSNAEIDVQNLVASIGNLNEDEVNILLKEYHNQQKELINQSKIYSRIREFEDYVEDGEGGFKHRYTGLEIDSDPVVGALRGSRQKMSDSAKRIQDILDKNNIKNKLDIADSDLLERSAARIGESFRAMSGAAKMTNPDNFLFLEDSNGGTEMSDLMNEIYDDRVKTNDNISTENANKYKSRFLSIYKNLEGFKSLSDSKKKMFENHLSKYKGDSGSHLFVKEMSANGLNLKEGLSVINSPVIYRTINSKGSSMESSWEAANTIFHEQFHGKMGELDDQTVKKLQNYARGVLSDQKIRKQVEKRLGKDKADRIYDYYKKRLNRYDKDKKLYFRVRAEEALNVVLSLKNRGIINEKMLSESEDVNGFVINLKKKLFGKLFAAGTTKYNTDESSSTFSIDENNRNNELFKFLNSVNSFSKKGGKYTSDVTQSLTDFDYDEYSDFNEDQDILGEQYEEGIIDEDTFEYESERINNRVKKQEDLIDGGHKDMINKAQKDFSSIESNKGKKISQDPMVRYVLHEMIENVTNKFARGQSDSDKDVLMTPDFYDKVFDYHTDRWVDKFNSEENDNFHGYVMSQLRNSIMNVFNSKEVMDMRMVRGGASDYALETGYNDDWAQLGDGFDESISYQIGKVPKEQSNLWNSKNPLVNPLNMFNDGEFSNEAYSEIETSIKPHIDKISSIMDEINALNEGVDKMSEAKREDVYSKIKEKENAIKDIVLENLMYSNNNNFVTNSIAKKFGLPPERLTKKSDYLRGDGKPGDEMDTSAKIIFDSAEDIIKILPQFNIALTGVSEEAKGAINISPLVLKNFYSKSGFEGEGRLSRTLEGNKRPGSSGNHLQKLIPMDKSEFLSKLGINENGKSKPGIKRGTPEANARMAVIRELGRFMTNTAGRMMLQEAGVYGAFEQDTRAGMSDAMMSEVDLAGISESYNINDKRDRIKIISSPSVRLMYGHDYRKIISKYYDYDEQGQINFVDEIVQKLSISTKRKAILDSMADTILNNPSILSDLKSLGFNGDAVDAINAITDVFNNLSKNKSELSDIGVEALSYFDKKVFGNNDVNLIGYLRKGLKIDFLKYAGDNKIKISGKIFKTSSDVDQHIFRNMLGDNDLAKQGVDFLNKIKGAKRKSFFTTGSDSFIAEFNKKAISLGKNQSVSEETVLKELLELNDEASSFNMAKLNLNNILIKGLNNKIKDSKTIEDYIKNVAFTMHVWLDDGDNFKRTSMIKKGGGLVSKQLLNGIFEGKYPARIEHWDMAIKNNLRMLNSSLTGRMLNKSMFYDSAVLEDSFAVRGDSRRIEFSVNNVKKTGKVVTYKPTSKTIDVGKKKENVRADIEETTGSVVALSLSDMVSTNDEINNGAPMTSEQSFIDTTMSNILKQATGIPASEQMSESTARLNAERRKKKLRRLAPSADDFAGLWYSFLGKGKIGEAQMAFFDKYLTEPLNKAYVAMTHARQEITRSYKDLNKEYEDIKKSLNKKSGVGKFTNDQAIRAYLYLKNGESISTLGLTENESNALNGVVRSNPRMQEYADYLIEIVANDGNWVASKPKWTLGSIVEDVERVIADTKRAQYLAEWKQNADIIFSKNNLNKIESHYGSFFRKALEDSIYRIEKGKAIPENTSKEMSEFQKWMSGAVSVTMFLNRRSALLQLMSLTNYINWGDNNPMMAAKAFSNIGQYSKDFVRIFNSDYLRERRGGLKTEVEAAVLANELRKSGADGYRGFVNKLLQKGFTLTQIGDSLAISLGGATFYRNRKNTYLKQGMPENEAHDKAWLDFIEATETSQQSARPDKLSSQQTSGLGRFLLNFQNTPMQYFRIFDKSVSNLVNRRGDPKEHISKILYYTFVAGAIFSYLQQALFAFADDDEEDEKYTAERQKRETRVINSTLDTMLKGSGIYGAYMATLKNVIIEFINQEEKGYKADHTRTFIEALNLSPPLGIKARKLYQGAYMNYKYNKEIMGDMGFDVDNPAYDVGGSLVSAGLNIPADEVINDIRGIKEAFDSQHDAWQRVALLLGYSTWNLGIPNEKIDFLKARNKQRKLDAAKDKRAKERAIKDKKKEAAKKKKEKESETKTKRKTTGLPNTVGLPKTTGLPKI